MLHTTSRVTTRPGATSTCTSRFLYVAVIVTLGLLNLADQSSSTDTATIGLTGPEIDNNKSNNEKIEEESATYTSIRTGNNKSQTSATTSKPPVVSECGIWLATSTIPNAGLGMYAGRDFRKDEMLQESGDVAVPIVDIRLHTGDPDFVFLWDEYTWNAVRKTLFFLQ